MTMLEEGFKEGIAFSQTPDTVHEPEVSRVRRPSWLRNTAGRLAFCGALGVSSAAIGIHAAPSCTEERLGAINLELCPSVGQGGLTILGEHLSTPDGVFGIDVDLEAPDMQTWPSIAPEVSEVVEELSEPDSDVVAVLQHYYGDRAGGLVTRFALKQLAIGGGLFAAGFLAGQRFNSRFRNRRGRHPGPEWNKAELAIGTAAFTGMFAGNFIWMHHSLDVETLKREAGDKALGSFISDELLTKTSTMVVNYDSINEELSKQLSRYTGLIEALSRPQESGEKQWVITFADMHGRGAYEIMRSVAQLLNPIAIHTLGDETDNGTPVENQIIEGYSLDGVEFMGLDDVRYCAEWDPDEPQRCIRDGEQVPISYLRSNHDEQSTIDTFEKLGARHLGSGVTRLGEALAIGIDDACFDPAVDCRSVGNTKKARQQAGIEAASRYESLDIAVVYTADYDAAVAFAKHTEQKGLLIVAGGTHRRGHEVINDNTIVKVGSIGQGGLRKTEEASFMIQGVTNGKVDTCLNVVFQSLDSYVDPAIVSCREEN